MFSSHDSPWSFIIFSLLIYFISSHILFSSHCVFLTSWQTFWPHDELLDVMACFWRHDVFLTSWRTCWCYDVHFNSTWTSWRKFWRHDVTDLRNALQNLISDCSKTLEQNIIQILDLWHNILQQKANNVNFWNRLRSKFMRILPRALRDD